METGLHETTSYRMWVPGCTVAATALGPQALQRVVEPVPGAPGHRQRVQGAATHHSHKREPEPAVVPQVKAEP